MDHFSKLERGVQIIFIPLLITKFVAYYTCTYGLYINSAYKEQIVTQSAL